MNKPAEWDYRPVAERIEAFYADHPNGSLQSTVMPELATLYGGDKPRVAVIATAYRDPDDKRPGIGLSWIEVPGATAFTRGSELENAETSARGRALEALGYGKGPTREEIDNKQPERDQPAREREASSAPAPAGVARTAEEQALLEELIGLVHSSAQLDLLAEAVQIPEGRRANAGELRAMIEIARRPVGEPTAWPEPGSAAYKALNPFERASAKAWHAKQAKRREQADADTADLGL